MTRVAIRPELLRWATARAGMSSDDLANRIPQLQEWERGEKQPTLKQLEGFAKTTHTPLGYLFLATPPVEEVPIPDFRTVADMDVRRPSPDLLDTVYLCQQRQDWYREFIRASGEGVLPFVGAASLKDDEVQAAKQIRDALGFNIDARRQMPNWTDALRRFIEQADVLGVLVMVSGVVGSNNRRKLNPKEFRGFALADNVAPLVFINGADSKAAQMFTLAHELAHIWLGQSALSDAQPRAIPKQNVERWCNRVAAELLVPMELFRDEYDRQADLRSELDRLARYFKVSTLVVLRRMHDTGTLRGDNYWAAYEQELEYLKSIQKGGGGNFYLTLGARASRRFARAVVVSTLEGRSSFTEAFRLLGFKKMATFQELGRNLGLSF